MSFCGDSEVFGECCCGGLTDGHVLPTGCVGYSSGGESGGGD